MNILLIKHFFVEFMVSEIPRVSVFGHYPYFVTFPYLFSLSLIFNFECLLTNHNFYLYYLLSLLFIYHLLL